MANCKEVIASGWCPFDANDNQMLLQFLGQCSIPTFGINVTWSGEKYEPNEFGGKTCFLAFHLSGIEALSWSYLDHLADLLKNNVLLESFKARDIEDGGGWVVFPRSYSRHHSGA